jgi:hypothetical protein
MASTKDRRNNMDTKEEPTTISGLKITHIATLGSRYDGGVYVKVFTPDGQYRLDVRNLIPLVQTLTFDVKQKRVWKHLVPRG